jgi:hypothetical protein
MEIITLAIYFVVGVVQDFFFTLNTRYVAEKKIVPAVVFSFLTVVMSMLVLYNIVQDIDITKGVLAIIIYSFGIATGTLLAMKLPNLKK